MTKPSDLTFHQMVSRLDRPHAERPSLTPKQRIQLNREIQRVSTGPAAEQPTLNRLRVQFRIRSIEELPAEQFDLALLLVRSLDAITREWRKLLNELNEAYIQDYLGGVFPGRRG
jgi:hypothetical protein